MEKARKEAPIRKIQSNSGNVITWYDSKKMGRAIGTESRTVEFPAAVQYEHDSKVLEYYPQPCKLDLILTDGEGAKSSRIQYPPDFLVIRTDQILIEEWREEKRLEKLAAKYPGRFVKENGEWSFPAAEEYLAEMGITFRLRSADEHPRQYVSNLIFLSDYLSPSCPPVEQKKLGVLRGALSEKGVITIGELIEHTKRCEETVVDITGEPIAAAAGLGTTADDVYKAIADGQIAFDLMNEDISETHRARVYRDETMLAFYQRIESSSADMEDPGRLDVSFAVGTEIEYDGKTYRIALVGLEAVMLSADDGMTEISLGVLQKQYAEGKIIVRSSVHIDSGIESPVDISPKHLKKGLERARQLEYANVAPELVTVSKRTLQRLRKAIREAGLSVIDKHLALVPQFKNSGNRERKIPQELIDAIEIFVKKEFNNAINIDKNMAYKKFLNACQSSGLKPCSAKTFYKEVDGLVSIRKRKGKRFFYQTQPIVWYLKLDEPIHGVRPFQYVHIDHTPLEILLCSPRRRKEKWHVWLSLAIDAESRRVVGFYLSFEPPSYRSCMMVLRDIVRRHGRMPDMLIVDNGKEFKSLEFRRVCKLYGCSIRYRPAGQPRHGSVMERLFGTTQSQLIHNLSGNTQLMRHVRMVTKSVNPGNFVEWTLPALHGALDYYFKNLYGTENHPTHGEGPVEHFTTRIAETGMRLHRIVRFDLRFLIETCPAPDSTGTRTVDWQRGVKVNHIWYWSDAFRSAGLHKKPVDVRIDPWDVRFVYALVNGVWQRCVSKLAMRLRQYTVIELRYAFEELAKEHNIKKKDLTPERIAEWMKVLDARNFDDRLREQQSEARLIYDRLGMATVSDTTFPSFTDSTSAPVARPSAFTINTSAPTIKESMATPEEEEEYELF
ncbi:MAG: DDE-type integrase/transposase/recombinase [Nitrospiraceae bacterium]|nr:DDE-type integrase/transposase/recombinase [Nitrospiraceae bacterium]